MYFQLIRISVVTDEYVLPLKPMNCFRYMTINNVKPSLTLNVVRMFKYVCEDSKVQKEVIEILTQDEVRAASWL